jgi:hypothetical protein
MGGNVLFVEWLPTQPPAQLRLANAAVAEEQDLDLRVDTTAGLQILVVSADFIQDVNAGRVFALMMDVKSRRHIIVSQPIHDAIGSFATKHGTTVCVMFANPTIGAVAPGSKTVKLFQSI